MYNEKLGIVEGFDYYDRKEICTLFNESDTRAFDYIADNCENKDIRRKAADLSNSGWTLTENEYNKQKWELLKSVGCFKTKYGEAYTRI